MKKALKLALCLFLVMTFAVTSFGFTKVNVKSIKLNVSSLSLVVGKTYALKVIYVPANTTQKLVNFTSLNKKVATVDKNGLVKAVSAGNTSIIATSAYNSKIVTRCNIVVSKPMTKEEIARYQPLGKYSPFLQVSVTRSEPAGIKFVDGETWGKNKIEKVMYEDSLGVKLKYQWVAPEAQFDQKMAVSIASDDLADIMSVNPNQFKMLSASNKLYDLTQLYEKVGSDPLKKCYSGDDGLSLGLGKINGKLLGLTNTASPMDTPNLIWIRYDWLKKLKLSEPKTMNDLFAIMDAFVNKDPDGNGQKDTLGIGLEKGILAGFAGVEGFFNGYHAYPSNWIKKENNRIESGLIQPEVRKALIKLQSLYKSGFIDKEFGVKDGAKVAEDTTNGKIGLVFGAMWNPLWPLQDSVNKDNTADWRPYPLVSIDEKAAAPSTLISLGKFFVVNKKAKNPEVLIKLANIQCEQWTGLFYGNDKHHEVVSQELTDEYLAKGVNQAWMYQYIGIAPANKNLNQHFMSLEIVDGKKPENVALKGVVDAIRLYEKDGKIDKWGQALVFGHNGSFNVINKNYYTPKNFFMNEFYGSPTKTMIEMNATLAKQQLEVFTRIIMGDSIELFDKFIADWNKLGGSEITKEVNDWYKNK